MNSIWHCLIEFLVLGVVVRGPHCSKGAAIRSHQVTLPLQNAALIDIRETHPHLEGDQSDSSSLFGDRYVCLRDAGKFQSLLVKMSTNLTYYQYHPMKLQVWIPLGES